MAVYVVFDVETPNRANDRMSAIGITAIKDNKIVANYFSLVDPETHFDYFNTQLTGIDADKVKGAPNFADLWKKIEPIMSKGILVAHNAVFDMSVLRACLRSYGITWKPFADYLCTVQINRTTPITQSTIRVVLSILFRGCGTVSFLLIFSPLSAKASAYPVHQVYPR